MQQVEAAVVELLSSLFRAPELRRLLEREAWGAGLVQHLTPPEHLNPLAWFHDLVVAVNQRGLRAELRALMLREREGRAAEIWAALPDVDSARVATPRLVATPPRPGAVPPNTRPAPKRRNPIRVLHLSDLHFSAKSAWDQMPVLTGLLAEVKALRAELGPIHRVVITGDIASFGTANEYAEAADWLNGALAEAAEVHTNQIRVVPGNHDVERSKVNRAVGNLDADILREGDATIAELMHDDEQRPLLLARQAAYRDFARGFNPHDDVPGWRSEEELEGWSVHLIGLNTAWLSGSHKDASGAVDDHRRLAIGGWQWNALFPADRPVPDLTIALMHHPWEDLAERDSRAHREATYDRCGVILRGHLHDVDTLSARRDGQPVLEAAAGACHALPSEGWPHGFQLLELDPDVGLAKVYLRKWHSRTRRWIPDRERYPNTGADGLIELELRRSPKASTSRAMTPAELALSRLFSEDFTTPALNAWLSADPRRALARSALDPTDEDQHDPFDQLAVTLTQLGLVDDELFTSLVEERPQSADAVAEAARACGVPLSTTARSLAAEAKPVDKRSRYSRLELVVELEELQKRRARSQRNQHDHDGLDDEINDVVRRLTDAPPPHKGAFVAGATLEKVIASGAFGAVWRGRAPDGQAVAVKMFRPEQLKAHMAAWGFRRGVRAMRLFERRRGPASLVRVLSVSEDELAFTMPFIDGATLEATDLTGWTLSQRLDCFQAIGEAIQFAHNERVIHRDLKPANIMIHRSGAPVVIDFDAADVGHATLLSMAINVGTLGYMAPEQSGALRASVLMDVYSLGRVLHYLLLGRHSAMSVAHEPIVRSELSTTPPALVGLVLRACNLSPEARPASVAELLRELGVARAALTVVEPDATKAVDPPVPPRRAGTTHTESSVPPLQSEVAPPEPPEAPSAWPRTAQAASPDTGGDVIVEEPMPLVPPSAVNPPQPPSGSQEAPSSIALMVSEPPAEARPHQPAAPRSSASVAEVVPDLTGSGVTAAQPTAPKKAPPSWGWRSFGAMVVVLSAVAACVKFGEEETPPATAEPVPEVAPATAEPEPVAEVAPTPVEPEAELARTPVNIGPCELPALGGPTGKTHKPKVAGLNMPFVGLSDGQFCMGSAKRVGNADERPQHPVKVSGFLLGKSEVTQAQWRAVVKAAKAAKDVDASSLNEDPSTFNGDKLPVEKVSWCDVTRFANALSRLDGRTPVYEITGDCAVRWMEGADGYRLPTEAEWEYATRAGSTTAYATGDDEAALAKTGWFASDSQYDFYEVGNSGGKTHEVCTAPKQPWGLCDLHGNVSEWVFDVYDGSTYASRAAAAVEPGRSMFDGSLRLAETASSGAQRVLRGGSWLYGSALARSAFRSMNVPSYSYSDVGFRLLLSPHERP